MECYKIESNSMVVGVIWFEDYLTDKRRRVLEGANAVLVRIAEDEFNKLKVELGKLETVEA